MFKISITPEEIENMPQGAFPGEIHTISKAGREYNHAIAYLRQQKMIGFDTETRPVFEPHKPHNHVALLQLSGPDHAYLFRLNNLTLPKRLCAILADKNILKIGAACHDDVRGLKHYAEFKEQGFVDLQKIGWEWGIKDKSVKKMAANILGVRISKAQQLSNWEAEQLSDSQKMYAATDAWVCLEMYKKLLDSPKNPLTPEQLAPNPPKNDQNSPKTEA